MKGERKYPVLCGFVKDGAIFVWCPYCKTHHVHGWPLPVSRHSEVHGDHRLAHCDVEDSPFRDGGYLVKPYDQKTLKRMGLRGEDE